MARVTVDDRFNKTARHMENHEKTLFTPAIKTLRAKTVSPKMRVYEPVEV